MSNYSGIQKRITICVFITLSSILNPLSAQSLTLSMPSSACVNQTFTVTANSTYSAPLSYQWSGSPGVIVNLNPSQVAITFSTCGSKLITCTGYDANNLQVPGASTTQVVSIFCQPAMTPLQTATAVCNGYSTTISAIGSGVTGYTWLPSGSTQPTLSAAAGSYTLITSTLPNGCLTTTVITISLAPPLNLMINASSPNSCIINNLTQDVKTISLTVDGATNYSWAPYNPAQMTYSIGAETTVKPTTNTCYTVTGTTSVCSGTAELCINTVPKFSIEVVPANTLICQGATVALGVTSVNGTQVLPGYTFKWTEDINAPSSISSTSGVTVYAFPIANATYTVEGFNTQNCISLPKTVTVNVAPCTGLNDIQLKENTVSIYPNPATNKVFLFSERIMDADIEILNVLGERLFSEKISFPCPLQTGFDVSYFPAGIYFIKASYNQNIELIRFIKN